MEFPEFLKQLRRNAGYTQASIAEMLGINRSTYAYYESGKTEPAIRHLKKLCNLYQLHMEDLVSCRYCPTNIVLNAPTQRIEDSSTLMSFRTLSEQEQLLVMLYRSCENPEALLNHIRSFEPETKES